MPKVKAKEKEGVTGGEFQKQFELFCNNEKQLDMKRYSLGLNQSRRKDVKYVNALKCENPRQYISLFSEDKESQENRKRKKVKKSKSNGIMSQLSSTVTDEVGCKENSKYILNEITGNLHPATDIEKAMCCKCKQTKRVDIGIQITTTNVSVTPTNSKAGTATNGDVTPYTEHDTHTNDNVTAENSSGSVPCESDMPTSNGATPENGSCENTSNVTHGSTSGEKEITDGNTNITD